MSRAALGLVREGADGFDLRLPIVRALVELYGPLCPPDAELIAMVAVLLPLEANALGVRPADR
jgi:hypothetical protein